MAFSDLQLLALYIDALFTHDPDGRMLAVNEPDGEPAPPFFLGRTREGNLWRFRHDLPSAAVHRLDTLAAALPTNPSLRSDPGILDPFRDALAEHHTDPPALFGPAYRFPDLLPAPDGVTRITRSDLHLLRAMDALQGERAQDFDAREPIFAVVWDGWAVSLTFSSRLTDRAAAAGVETLGAYRQRGYAAQAVAAWANAVRAGGRIPFYDTSWQNLASQGVARKLGLIQFAEFLAL